MKTLERRLDEALAREDYEEAAKLRDAIALRNVEMAKSGSEVRADELDTEDIYMDGTAFTDGKPVDLADSTFDLRVATGQDGLYMGRVISTRWWTLVLELDIPEKVHLYLPMKDPEWTIMADLEEGQRVLVDLDNQRVGRP